MSSLARPFFWPVYVPYSIALLDAALVEAQRVAELVHGNREEVVGRADVVRLARVEGHVAGDREVVARRRLIGQCQGGAAEVVAADPDVAESRIALLVCAEPSAAPLSGTTAKLMLVC